MASTSGVFLFTLPAVAAALAGGIWAAWRPPKASSVAVVQHLAAGIVFAATALELLPKERTEAAFPVIVGFACGLALMLLVRGLSRMAERRTEGSRFPTGVVAVTGVDLLIDGLVLGIAFAAGEKAGILLAVALTLEVLFLSLSVSGSLSKRRIGRALTASTPAALALLLSVGAVCGRLFFGSLPPFPFAVLLGVGIVALLYLVVEELLVEAHEVPETPWMISAFFVGFLLFLILEMLLEAP